MQYKDDYKPFKPILDPLNTWALQALVNNRLHQALSPTNPLETPSLNRQSKATKLVRFGFQPPIVSIPSFTSQHSIFVEGEEGYKFLQVYVIWERNREEKMCRNFGLRLRFSLSQQEGRDEMNVMNKTLSTLKDDFWVFSHVLGMHNVCSWLICKSWKNKNLTLRIHNDRDMFYWLKTLVADPRNMWE